MTGKKNAGGENKKEPGRADSKKGTSKMTKRISLRRGYHVPSGRTTERYSVKKNVNRRNGSYDGEVLRPRERWGNQTQESICRLPGNRTHCTKIPGKRSEPEFVIYTWLEKASL